MFFADQQIDAGNRQHNCKQNDRCGRRVGRIAAAVARNGTDAILSSLLNRTFIAFIYKVNILM